MTEPRRELLLIGRLRAALEAHLPRDPHVHSSGPGHVCDAECEEIFHLGELLADASHFLGEAANALLDEQETALTAYQAWVVAEGLDPDPGWEEVFGAGYTAAKGVAGPWPILVYRGSGRDLATDVLAVLRTPGERQRFLDHFVVSA